MLQSTAFLPVLQADTGVSLFEAGTAGSTSASFQCFRQETNNHLEGWHNRLNKKARGNKLRFNKLFQLLMQE
ncbi:hypothetical protein T03_16201 [Trichinella britovi]|uniref:Uncharacterized protein n=1 Tax=Trichinella britovi TaxID=45882 RepID=A0A0V1CUW3_TRIBR|nr:hypothetical protein T03_16201 [Trichinella britovi]